MHHYPLATAKGLLFRAGAISLALLPFAMAEVALRVLDRGRVSEQHDPFVGFTAIHPLFVRNAAGDRYETSPSRRTLFYPDSFAAEKAPHEYRIFCLGGSTVQGSPYSIETSFTTWLELSLQAADPDRSWEVVNCGGLSYASYRLVPILQEVLTREADLIVLYTGHNEFLEDRTYTRVKRAPRWLVSAHARCSQLRTYNACRAVWLRAILRSGGARTLRSLPADVDAWLDYPDGLQAYHRDDDWRNAAMEHYRYNLERMVHLAANADVPLVICNPVSNLKDCPPFKFENVPLSAADQRRFDALWEQAKELPETRDDERVELLTQALALDDRHAAAHFLLGHCYLRENQPAAAKAAILRAKEEDICPLRMLEPMHEALADMADAYSVPVVDVRRFVEQKTPDGIPGAEWLIDHVHPTISGHQAIAELLMERLIHMGIVRPRAAWESYRQEAYRDHLATLDAPYFARGKERLEGQRLWTEGHARRLHRPASGSANAP